MCELAPGALHGFIIHEAGSLSGGSQEKNIIAKGLRMANDSELFVCLVALNVEFQCNTELVLYWISSQQIIQL